MATEHQVAFDLLKKKMCTETVLVYADFMLPFEVEIDASLQDWVLCFPVSRWQKRVISYASRTLRGAEKNMQRYSSMKLELFGMKWAVTEKFREYLLGAKYTVYTDNYPLAHLKSAKLDAVGQRWVGALACFDFEVKYKPGKNNKVADALSRRLPSENQNDGSSTFEAYVNAAGMTTIADRLKLVLTLCSVNTVTCERSQSLGETPVVTSSLLFPSYT